MRIAVTCVAVFFAWSVPAFADTFTVTNTNDDGIGSLRAAIIAANGSSAASKTIDFAIPSEIPAVYTIALATPLPDITAPLTIDGTSQPGSVGGPVIVLDGKNVPTSGLPFGLHLASGSSGSVIRGLVIDNFPENGIEVDSNNNTIAGNYVGVDATGGVAAPNNHGIAVDGTGNVVGGTSDTDRNVLSGNHGAGVYLAVGTNRNTDANTVQGNYVGTDSSGATAVGNTDGVIVYGSSNKVLGNLVSGNGINIQVLGPDAGGTGASNVFQGNTIGTDATRLVALGAGTGIALQSGASSNQLTGNDIAGVGGVSVSISSGSNNNIVQGNSIGPDANGEGTLGAQNGQGVYIAGSSGNLIGGTGEGSGNVIAFNQNANAGVVVTDQGGAAGGNSILGNSIYSNKSTGIDLAPFLPSSGVSYGVTANDDQDGDTGPNGLQNYPLITALSTDTTTTLSGTLNSTPSATFHLEIFKGSTCDTAGQTPVRQLSVTTGADGNTSWSLDNVVVNPGDVLVATATSSGGDTSEFSPCFTVPGGTGTTTNNTGGGTTTDATPPAADGTGTLTTPLAPVVAGSTGNTITFTYTAEGGGLSGGVLTLAVPTGWSDPSTRGTDPGYSTTSNGTLAVAGRLIEITNIALAGGESFTITYGDKGGDGPGATAPTTTGTQEWTAQEQSATGGALAGLVSPSVAVIPARGSDSLTFGTIPTATQGGTATIPANNLHLNALPGKADIEIAIDTTSSMDTSIAQAKVDATNLVNSVQAGIPDAQFSVVQFRDTGDTPVYQVEQPLTASADAVQSKINGLVAGGGGDLPEAYNLVFHNSYTPALGGDIGWRTGSRKFVVVIGDAQPHGALSSRFPGCADVTTDSFNTATELAGMKSNERTLFMMRQASTASTTLQCYQSLAAAAFDGGEGVDAGSSLGAQIVGLVQTAAAHVGTVSISSNTDGFTFTPANPIGPLTAPVSSPFDATLTVDPTVSPGPHTVSVTASADGVVRATATFDVTVKTPLSDLTINATPINTGAGITSVPIASIPNAWLAFFSGSTSSSAGIVQPPTTSTPVGSIPVGSIPVGSIPVGSIPVGSVPVGSIPVGSIPVGSVPVGSIPVGSIGLLDLPVGSIGLNGVLLSQIPLCGDVPLPNTDIAQCKADHATWSDVLDLTNSSSPFYGRPLNAIPLSDVVNDPTAKGKLGALPIRDVSFETTLLKSVHWTSLLLGRAPLLSLPVPSGFDSWCGSNPVLSNCAGITSSTTVMDADISGHLASAPVGSVPVGSIPVGSIPVGSIPVGSISLAATDISASKLAAVKLDDISAVDLPSVVTCGAFACAGKTLGDAYVAGAIVPTVTFTSSALKTAFTNAGITVNDILAAILNRSPEGLPWEQLPVQGLQPYSVVQSHVTYTAGANVECGPVSNFAFTFQLPKGFFPVDGTAKLTINGGGPQDAPTPVPLTPSTGPGAAATQGSNAYTSSLSCGATQGLVPVSFTFGAYAGLDLGTFTTKATASAGTFSLSATGAPVTVTQTGEPGNDSADTAPLVAPGSLVVGFIANSGDQDFYSLDLTNMRRGTKVSVFLKPPANTDLDLSISRPAAKSFLSTPVGSVPVGSIPIEDNGVGLNASPALPSDTLQDVPVGSVPVGSIPVGSIPVGSISATRGDANEAVQIISDGNPGVATIDVTGYNGATSPSNYVLRVKVTPPPPTPAACPARQLTVSSANQGSLPASLPTTTKSLFIVNKQRLMAMYGTTTDGATAVNNFLSALTTLAARPEVAGAVLQVDGDAAVRAAYTAWDATGGPCDPSKANDVVRAINDVVARYRNTSTGLPNLHYIVIGGSNEMIPMARTPDPVTLSPEENFAGDLAFTTNGLTAGNALYNSAAENDILTDGAYGAFLSIPWLGHDLLLPQVSVSRLVETPGDMTGQITRYLQANGYTGTPQSGVGTLNPRTLLSTGYDFLADGAQSIQSDLQSNFSLATAQSSIGSHNPITPPAPTAVLPWTAADIFNSFFQPSGAADVAALNAHYNQYEFEASDTSIGSTADPSVASAQLQARILFTMGCHGGLNVPDTLLPGSTDPRLLDWPQVYGHDQAAVYIGNTGFGYGDSDSVALSERLLALFSKNLHSDAQSVGEEWAQALQQYFATAGAYDVYDEKVMEETTFYGLPFWHFSTAGNAPTFTPVATSTDPVTGTPSATITFPSTATTTGQSQFGLYRPTLPIASQEVTSSSLPARGLWIKALSTDDGAGDVPAKIGMPTIDLSAHEPKPPVTPIFFPASPFTLEHSVLFGKEHDYVDVSDQFRPNQTTPSVGRQRHVTSATFEIFYSNSPDRTAPLISQVNVSLNGTTANIQTRITDDSGAVDEANALVNDGTMPWKVVTLQRSAQDPTLWTGSVTVARDPEVFIEATDGQSVSYSANKGSNFTSANSSAASGPQILLQAPSGPYAINQAVNATYQCVVNGAPLPASQCVGSVATGSPIDTHTFGKHTFVVTALNPDNTVIGSLQRTYVVQYMFKGFFSPVDNEPTLNTVNSGRAIPVKFSLSGNQGLDIFAAGYPKSQQTACDATAPADGVETTLTAGSSSLSYDPGADQYTYVWKTDSNWANSCRALILKLKDGSTRRADFKFTK